MFNFQLYSDLHLEFREDFPKIPILSENIILAGDIGKITDENFKNFITFVSKNWERVFVVLGNHEFYYPKSHFDKLKNKYNEFFKSFNNIYLFDKTILELEDVLILGGTFWTKIDSLYQNLLNDFNFINYYDKIKNRKFRINSEFINQKHIEEKKWLDNNLKLLDTTKSIIIISHFPLTQENTSHPKYNNQSEGLRNYFSNDFSDIFIKYPKLKIINVAGHTHFNYDFTKNNVRFISNQMGYPDDKISYQDKLFNIDTFS